MSYSGGEMARNFDLGQTQYNYDFFNRSSKTDGNGKPGLSTPTADQVLQASLQHVVVTFDPVAGRKIYVNGVLKAIAGSGPWRHAQRMGRHVRVRPRQRSVGHEDLDGRRSSRRDLQPRAHATADQAELRRGRRREVLPMFSVEHLTNIPQSFVVFEGSLFDSYSYLFRKPFFISLDGTAQPVGLDIDGIRVGINGSEAPVGQSFAHVAKKISSAYMSGTGEGIADLGAVLPVEKGPNSDEFFLTFDTIGASTFNRPPPATPPPPPPTDLPPVSAIGVRTFDRISASMAAITNVSENTGPVGAGDWVSRPPSAESGSRCPRSRTSRPCSRRTKSRSRSSRLSSATR